MKKHGDDIGIMYCITRQCNLIKIFNLNFNRLITYWFQNRRLELCTTATICELYINTSMNNKQITLC